MRDHTCGTVVALVWQEVTRDASCCRPLQATCWARLRWSRRWWSTRPWPRLPWWVDLTQSRGRASTASSRSARAWPSAARWRRSSGDRVGYFGLLAVFLPCTHIWLPSGGRSVEVLSHPGQFKGKQLSCGNWICSRILKMFGFSSQRLLQFQNEGLQSPKYLSCQEADGSFY